MRGVEAGIPVFTTFPTTISPDQASKREGVTYLEGRTAGPDRWLQCSAGTPGFRFDFHVWGDGKSEVHLELTRKEEAYHKAMFDRLYQDKNRIEERCGVTLKWDRRNENPASYIRWVTGTHFNVQDESKWEGMQAPMFNAMSRFIPVMEPYLDAA